MNIHLVNVHMQCFFQWEHRSHTFSSQTLFISVFYIETPYECDNAFLNIFS